MRQGAAISAAIHGGLLAWAMFGGLISPDPPETELKISEVTLLSEADLTSLGSPEIVFQPNSMEAPPVFDENAHFEVPAIEAPAVEVPPLPDEPSLIPENPPPLANPDTPLPGILDFAPPDLDSFQSPVVDLPEPPPTFEVAPPSERVDTSPAPRPEPEVKIAETAREEIVPSEDAEPDLPAKEQEATAKKEASTRIVTEAEQSPAAVFSIVPPRRPAAIEMARREEESAKQQDSQPPQSPNQNDQIRSAIIQDRKRLENLGAAGGEKDISDEPLTVSDIEGLNRAIQPCWNVGALSSEAARVVVTISIRFDRDGKPVKNEIRRVEASRGSDAAQSQAYEVAIRAVTQCLRSGYEFPPEKYEQWKQIELTFNPEKMRLK